MVVVHILQYGLPSPLRTWRAPGILLAISSDSNINPFLGILRATTQQSTLGENLSCEQPVVAYTQGGACAESAEAIEGTLQLGRLADLTVLSQGIFSVPAAQLLAIRSVLTVLNGKTVCRAPRQMVRRTLLNHPYAGARLAGIA